MRVKDNLTLFLKIETGKIIKQNLDAHSFSNHYIFGSAFLV